MSNLGKFHDTTPDITAAGKVVGIQGSISDCLKTVSERAITPPGIQKYRKSAREVLGQTIVHYGKAADAPPPSIRFGRENEIDRGGAAAMINPKFPSQLEAQRQREAEITYRRVREEPLGQTISRDYNFPQEALENEFQFGMKSKRSESAKGVIFPEDPDDVEEQSEAIYRKSHSYTQPGEQKCRNYTVDLSHRRFGKMGRKSDVESAASCLGSSSEGQDSSLINFQKEQFQSVTVDELGKPKNHGFGDRANADITFGMPSGGKHPDLTRVADCFATNDDTFGKEDDLGRSTRAGFRNVVPEKDNNRSFGLPSVRRDVRAPRQKSVADNTNYGNEPSAKEVLSPTEYSAVDVHEDDFALSRSKNGLRDVVLEALDLSESEFEELYTETVDKFHTAEPSVDQFRMVFCSHATP